ncbi:hypothetical protein EVG20_g8012, partial [Dentipellis fragilis]
SALPNLFGTAPTPDPRFSFSPSPRFNAERHTSGLGVKYHVNSAEFTGHPIYAEIKRAAVAAGQEGAVTTPNAGKVFSPALKRFEDGVDRAYTQELYSLCQRGLDAKQRRKDQAIGIFGFGVDWDQVRAIEAEKVEACERLRALGLLK